jgi:PAS domain S-box-containing protein
MGSRSLPFPDFLDPANPLVAPIRAIFDAMRDLFFILHEDGSIRRVNRTAQQRLGYAEQDLAGHLITEIHAPEQSAEVLDFVAESIGGTDRYCRAPLVTADGELIPAETSATRISWGPIKMLVWTCRDVSQRARAEDALRESEERYRTMIDSLGDMVHVVDSERRIVLCNEAFRSRLAGLGIETDPVGQNVPDLMPFLPDRIAGEYDQVFESGEPLVTEETVDLGDSVAWTETRKIPLVDNGEGVSGVVTVIRDVTQRKQLEEELRQVQKMETLGALAGGVAHDFNNLLMAIKVFAGFARDPRPGGILPEHALQEVVRAADSAQTLTSQLLAFSRRQLLRPRVLDLNRVVGELEELLKRLIGPDAELVFFPTEDLWPVKADRSLLEQVLVNLTVNARDAFSRGGGRLTIALANVSLDERASRVHPDARPGEFVRIRVSDNGQGMEQSVRQRIFEPFFTTKEFGRGTGLGLSTAYGTTRQHGGFILVESAVGQGATFEVHLPRCEDPPHEPAGPVDEEPELRGGETVLVAEDEPVVKRLMLEVLDGLGYRVIGADGGRAALEAAREHAGEIDLLVSDVVMPEIGGRELAERLVRERPGMRVLFVTGYTDDEIVRRGFFEGEVPLLRKPFTAEEFAREVRTLLDRGTDSSPDDKQTIPPR